MYPDSLSSLIEEFKLLPGVGEKTAERYAFSIVSQSKDNVNNLISSLNDVNKKIKKCLVCDHITENEICDICQSKVRNNKILCVVEDSQSIIIFEKTGVYDGLYFILNGLISPLEDIGPEDINLGKLINRIKEDSIEEIILALKPSIESETTSLYMVKLLEDLDVVVTRIAQGIPMGGDIQYTDSLTLERALEDRKKIS